MIKFKKLFIISLAKFFKANLQSPNLLIFNLLIFNLLIFQSPNLFAQVKENKNGYNILYFENGKKSSEGTFENGKPNGYWKTYYENEVLKSEGNRVNFELSGEWKFYKEDGSLKLIITYENGKKNGLRKTFYTEYYTEENFVNDIKQGFSKTLDYKNKVLKQAFFIDGSEDGIAKEYDTTGLVIVISEYKSGFLINEQYINRKDFNNKKQGVWKWFNSSGNVIKEAVYKNDLLNGYYKEFDDNGNLIKILKYKDGIEQVDAPELTKYDVKRSYYSTGKVKTIASYKQEKLEGVKREFSEDGSITKSFIYNNGIVIGEGIVDLQGLKQGDWKEYYNDGTLKAIGKYINGLKMGDWKYFHANGKSEQEGKYYPAGQPDGIWKWYYENGVLEREEEFERGKESGYYKEYNDSAKLIVEGQYIEGDKTGEWKYSFDNYFMIGNYRDGLKNGIWKGFYGNGKLAFEGNYVDDFPDQKHSYYNENGMLRIQGWYDKGKKQGEWKTFNKDGSLFLNVTYDRGLEKAFDGIKITPDFDNSDEDIINN
ncbi:MAG: hypothetical protein WCK02_01510 [Bacteroidota bacterium]